MKHKIFAGLFSKIDRPQLLPPRGNVQSFLPPLNTTTHIAEYDESLINELGLLALDAAEIREELERYLAAYKSSFANSAQEKYFEVFERG